MKKNFYKITKEQLYRDLNKVPVDKVNNEEYIFNKKILKEELDSGCLFYTIFLLREISLKEMTSDGNNYFPIADELMRIQYALDNLDFHFYDQIKGIFDNYSITINIEEVMQIYEIFFTYIYYNKSMNIKALKQRVNSYLDDFHKDLVQTQLINNIIQYYENFYRIRQEYYKNKN